MQNIVREAESILQACAFIRDLQETIIRDGDEGVSMFLEFANAYIGGLQTFTALERERTRHNADGQRAAFFCHLCHNGCGACAGPAAHACSDENHIRAFQHVI